MAARDPLLSPAEVHEWTGIPVQTLQAYRSQGRGPDYIKIGNKIKYRQSVIEKFLDNCTVKTAG